MTDRIAFKLIGLFGAISFILFLSPRLRFDSLKYLEVPRSIVFDLDLNAYNEEAYFTNPGWADVLSGKLFHEKAKIISFMSHPEYTDAFYKFVFFPAGSIIVWVPPIFLIHNLYPFISHIIPSAMDNGYSYIYQIGYVLWNYIIFLLGLITAYKTLKHFFSAIKSLFLVFVVVLSSNIIPFVFMDICFSHCVDFFLITLIVNFAIHIDDKNRYQMFLWGVVLGLSAVIRYQDIAFLMLPIMYFFSSNGKNTFTRGVLLEKIRPYGLLGLGFIIPIAFQMLYWHILFGTCFISASTMGISKIPSFDIYHVQLLQVFFSKFHGLFSWMPLLIPAFIGVFLLPLYLSKRGVPLLIVFLIEVYYNASRTEWWNLGFSVRRYSGFIIFFMLGLGFFLSKITIPHIKYIVYVMLCFLCFWNIVFLTNFYSENFDRKLISELVGSMEPYAHHDLGIIMPSSSMIRPLIKRSLYWFKNSSIIIKTCIHFLHLKNYGSLILLMCITGIGLFIIFKLSIKTMAMSCNKLYCLPISIIAVYLIALSGILLYLHYTSTIIYFCDKKSEKKILVPLRLHKNALFYGDNKILAALTEAVLCVPYYEEIKVKVKILFRNKNIKNFHELEPKIQTDKIYDVSEHVKESSIRRLSTEETVIFQEPFSRNDFSYYLFEAVLDAWPSRKICFHFPQMGTNIEIISIWFENICDRI